MDWKRLQEAAVITGQMILMSAVLVLVGMVLPIALLMQITTPDGAVLTWVVVGLLALIFGAVYKSLS